MAKHFGNVVHLPIMTCEPQTRILDVFPPPELHLLIGPVTLLYKGLQRIWKDGSEEWAKKNNVQLQERQGGTFTGNSCKTLLNNIAILEELMCPHQEFVDAFVKFKAVVVACYGKELQPNARDTIREFEQAFTKLVHKHHGTNVTSKIHSIIHHVHDFCSSRNTGLGVWSEQASEAVHSDFLACSWTKYKVSEVNTRFGKQLLLAVQNYASKHMCDSRSKLLFIS